MNSLQLNIEGSDGVKKPQNYQREWENYRVINRNFLFLCVGFFVLVLLTELIGKTIGKQTFYLYILLIYGLIVFYFSIKLKFWKCPECGEHFHKRSILGWMFSKNCLHCGLPKYEGSIYKKL